MREQNYQMYRFGLASESHLPKNGFLFPAMRGQAHGCPALPGLRGHIWLAPGCGIRDPSAPTRQNHVLQQLCQ